MEKEFNINNLINMFIKGNIGNFKLQDNFLIKFRYEYFSNNKINNIFIYLDNWRQLIDLYNIIPDNKKHFYEIINNKCKFFLDLDAKCQEIDSNEWNDNIIFIKKEIKKLFEKTFNKNVEIIEYQSFPTKTEAKYSCHLVIPDYCFYADDCKNICNMLLNKLNSKCTKIIDCKVYGKRRMLRIEGSSKINSNRIKICINKKNNQENIRLDGLITNLQNTELLYTKLYNLNAQNIEYEHGNKTIILKQYNKKYGYTNNDIVFVKNNFKEIINKINKFHDNNKIIFTLNYIINNMLILKRIKSCFCFDCKRIHDKQHPYIFMINDKLFFHCRRSPKPINVTHILEI